MAEPNAMTLATVAADGQPTLRTVLLKVFDHRGFVFFTNYGSRKARQIAENHQVALLFPWVKLARQVVLTGLAEKISTAESARYFASRPRESQLGAWISQQSSVLSSRQLLMSELSKIKVKFLNGEVPLPDFWGGYRGSAAPAYRRIERALNRWCVECCNEQGWEIPFPQMTIHRPASERS
ncbi:hypothetical protein B566_EDAN019436 [Ephemera danica]|nr:hypothetical protein B566_EDAN019436 [Ephemera danica]